MALLFTNNASTTLTGDYLIGDTTVVVNDGSAFAIPANGDVQKITFENQATGEFEICHLTSRAVDTLTILRAQEGTQSIDLPSADIIVEARLTAECIAGQFDPDGGEIALGTNSNAAGTSSIAIGENAAAIGNFGVTSGYSSQASGQYGVASGGFARASASYAVAVGFSNLVSGESGVAVGHSNTNPGARISVIGSSNTVTGGLDSAIVGTANAATDCENTGVVGNSNTVEGSRNLVLGNNNTVDGNKTIVAGQYITTDAPETTLVMAKEVQERDLETSVQASVVFGDRSIAHRTGKSNSRNNGTLIPPSAISMAQTAFGSAIDLGVVRTFTSLGSLPVGVVSGTIWSDNGSGQYVSIGNPIYADGTGEGVFYDALPSPLPTNIAGTNDNNVIQGGVTVHIDPSNYYFNFAQDETTTDSVKFLVQEFGVYVYDCPSQSGTVQIDFTEVGSGDAIGSVSFTLSSQGGPFCVTERVAGLVPAGTRYKAAINSTTLTDYCSARLFILGCMVNA